MAGDNASLRQVARLADVDLDEAAQLADELVRMTILSDGEGLSFARPIVRNSVYEDIGRRSRARLHARAARMLFGEDAAPETVSSHLMRCDSACDGEAVRTLRRAARRALARGAPEIAVRFLIRALDEPPCASDREEVLYELALAEAKARLSTASEHLAAALEAAVDPARRALIAVALAIEWALKGGPSDRLHCWSRHRRPSRR